MNKKLMAEAVALHKSGQHKEAKQKYAKLAVQFPRDPDLLHFRGLLASHMGDQDEAVRLLKQAIERKPDMPEFYQNLAIAYQRSGNNEQASIAYNQQGVLLQKVRRYAEVMQAFEKSLACDPTNHRAANNYGASLNETRDYERALSVLLKVQKYAKTPQEISFVRCNIANSYFGMGKIDRALKYFDEALKFYPENIEAHRNRSLMILGRGDLGEGFIEYEWRCIDGVHYMETRKALSGSRVWQGEPPEEIGGAILVLAEQGLGDTIHFSRYVPMLAARGHSVIFEVQKELYNLFAEGWADNDRIRVVRRQPSGKVFNDLPFAALVSVMSLPARFGTTLKTVPGDTPYLGVDPKRVAQWDGLMPRDGCLNIGLVWQGSFLTPHDKIRSMPATALEPLLARKNMRFYSLQIGEAAKHKFTTEITALDEKLRDFADTAGAIRHLDLLISIDSSVAHLAGALDCPVWIAMPRILDWRWMIDREDTPWYPKTRLFRQKKPDDWNGAIKDIGKALDKLSAKRGSA